MATVYLAHDLKHDRGVALKVLRPELAATLGTDRFLSEIRTTAKLNHPHILALHDSGEAGGFLFYVMPLVEGESLRERMTRDKTLPIEVALRLTREVGDALTYAHAHDVIHRDIKPENILLQSDHAVVADFGIARAVRAAGAERITMTGMALGTPAYMSPEQSAGERDVDGRSDLYALASILYEMLTGEPPFTGTSIDAILAQRFTRPPPRISTKRPNVLRAVDAAVFTAMARAPEDRFPSIELFVRALDAKGGTADAQPLERSIAVLPFANMSGDPENEYFSDGISEEIINALTQLRTLRVAARTSAFSFKGKNTDLRAIGDQLNVNTVLEGSVRKAGGRIRITAQLINVADGYHLWSERYDRELTDVFAIQDEIATSIAGKLRVTLDRGSDGQLVRPPTANVDAYDLYLKGHALIQQRGPALPRAVECFEQALALDPLLALAHAELGEALLLMSLYGSVPPADIQERAREATSTALRLDPNLVTGQIVLGLLSVMAEFDREKATAAFARAVELDPKHGYARTVQAVFSHCYIKGDFERGPRQLRAVVESDPLNAMARAQLAQVLVWCRETDEAVAQARRGIELDPQAFYPYWSLIHALALGPDPREALEVGQPLLSRFGRHPWLMMGMALASGSAGERDRGAALYAELEARSHGEYVQPGALAAAAIGAGFDDRALQHVNQAVAVRDPLFAVMAMHWPGYARFRQDPRFVAALRQLGWERPV